MQIQDIDFENFRVYDPKVLRQMGGYVKDIDASRYELSELQIIAEYSFDDLIPCGLAHCHTKNKWGVIVKTNDGKVTNMGHNCAETHYGSDFKILHNKVLEYERHYIENKELRNRFAERKTLSLKILELIPSVGNLSRQLGSLQTQVSERLFSELVRRGYTQDTEVSTSVRKTARELEITEVQLEQAGHRLEKDKDGKTIIPREFRYKQQAIGSLRGLGVFTDDARNILIVELKGTLREFEKRMEKEVEFSRTERSRFYRWSTAVEEKIKKVEWIVSEGNQFFARTNMQLLPYLTADESEKLALEKIRVVTETEQENQAQKESLGKKAS